MKMRLLVGSITAARMVDYFMREYWGNNACCMKGFILHLFTDQVTERELNRLDNGDAPEG